LFCLLAKHSISKIDPDLSWMRRNWYRADRNKTYKYYAIPHIIYFKTNLNEEASVVRWRATSELCLAAAAARRRVCQTVPYRSLPLPSRAVHPYPNA
jgi:hypothetical protein